MKIFLLVVFLVSAIYEFGYLLKLNDVSQSASVNLIVSKLKPIEDLNISLSQFFDPSHWLLTQADRAIIKKKKEKVKKKDIHLYDKNTTVELITVKGTKKLCRGKKCISIKGIIGNKLLLEENNGSILTMKQSDIIFKNIKLLKLNSTELLFLNNDTKEEYALKFFTYKQNHNKKEKNGTK